MIGPEQPEHADTPAVALSLTQPVDSSLHTRVLYLLILPVYLLHTWRFNFLCDDAFISFRYARNLADGLGLRFNPGESPPVEGFSNFLWVLALSVFEGLGLSPVVWSRRTSFPSRAIASRCRRSASWACRWRDSWRACRTAASASRCSSRSEA